MTVASTTTANHQTQPVADRKQRQLLRPSEVLESMRRNWGWILVAGIASIIVGIAAIALPVASSMAVETVFAASLVVSGTAVVIGSFFVKSWSGFFARLANGLLNTVVGVVILANPIAGLVSLTMLVAAMLATEGVLRIVAAWRSREILRGWGWMVAGGVASLLFAAIIVAQLPDTAMLLIGTLLGINIVFSGISYVLLAFAARRLSCFYTA